MAETTTLARPYAKAVFELAMAEQQLQAWSKNLAGMAMIAVHPEMDILLKDPRVDSGQAASLFIDAGKGHFNEQAQNLIQLLAEYHRLPLLPDILALFEYHRAEAEKTLAIDVTVPMALDDVQQKQLQSILEKRFARNVSLSFHIDPSLIGGAVIRAGDHVIDGSVSGRLARLADTLNS